jgi:hypothetical protein
MSVIKRLRHPAAWTIAVLATAFATLIMPSVDAQIPSATPDQLIQEAFRGELVYTQEAGEVQLTLGSDVTRSRLQAPGTLSVGAEYGITAAWQVSVEWQVPAFAYGAALPSTLTAGVKRAWMHLGGSGLDLAGGVDLSFPLAGPARVPSTEVEPFVVLAANPAGGALHLFAGVSFGVQPLPGEGNVEEASGLVWHAGIIARAAQLRFVAELDRERHGEMSLTPGVVWRGSSAFQIGIAAPVGLTDAGNRPQLIAKVTYEFHGND